MPDSVTFAKRGSKKSIPPIIPIFPAIEARRAAQNSRLAGSLVPYQLPLPREEQRGEAANATGSRATRGIAGSDDNIKLVVPSRRGATLAARRACVHTRTRAARRNATGIEKRRMTKEKGPTAEHVYATVHLYSRFHLARAQTNTQPARRKRARAPTIGQKIIARSLAVVRVGQLWPAPDGDTAGERSPPWWAAEGKAVKTRAKRTNEMLRSATEADRARDPLSRGERRRINGRA